MTQAFVPLADGVEEMEAVIIIDTLRRADWTVSSVAIGDRTVTASRGVRLLADTTWNLIDPLSFDALVIPGGAAGVKALKNFEPLLRAIRRFVTERKLVGAICAGPLVLQEAGVLGSYLATCSPAVRDQFRAGSVCDDRVVIDGRIVTSQGPGTCFEFALALIGLVNGRETADAVAKAMVC